jgi:polyhydroxyalkanoate synthesis regulator phasin
MKNLLKEMVYLGLGTAVAAKHKTEELLEKLINQHSMTRDEGQRVIDNLKAHVQRAKHSSDEQLELFVQHFAEKSNLAKEEIHDLIQNILDKPKKAKKRISNQTHLLAQKMAEKTALTKDQANDLLHDFTDDIIRIRQEAIDKGKVFSDKIDKAGKKGKAFVDDLEARSDLLLNEVRPSIQRAMDKAIDRLHLANTNDVGSLEKRIEQLEEKETLK